MVDYNLLRLLAQEALSNAFKYAAPGSPILVTARMVAGA
jgi:two-component sensor histidine kinase